MCPCLCPFYFLSVSFLYFCFLPSPSLMDPFTLQNERQDSYLHYRRSWILCTLMTFLKFPYLAILFLWSIRIDHCCHFFLITSSRIGGYKKLGIKSRVCFLVLVLKLEGTPVAETMIWVRIRVKWVSLRSVEIGGPLLVYLKNLDLQYLGHLPCV